VEGDHRRVHRAPRPHPPHTPPPGGHPGRRATVSACIITKNEEARLPTALASVAWCDEILVVDSGSTDDTCRIAEAAGARVIHNPWPGYSAQRNLALEHAVGEWALEIDADERLSPRLAAEIQEFLALPPPADVLMATMPLRERFLGRELGPSAGYPDYKSRLFRRSEFRLDEARVVHEGLWPRGRVWRFAGELEHTLADTPAEAVADTWRYARLESAQVPPPKGAMDYLFRIAVRPTVKFAYRFGVKGGWRDGWQGWVKISLDCLSDLAVWTRRLFGRGIPLLPEPAPAAGSHDGRGDARASVRVVAVAHGAPGARAAAAWLERARSEGWEVGLITDQAGVALDGEAEIERVPALTLLRLIRALDRENQVRSVDALLVADDVTRRLVRRVPGLLKGFAGPFDLADDPADAKQGVLLARRR
jgi:glycosyltransferase involved in cell wall biosynthesis